MSCHASLIGLVQKCVGILYVFVSLELEMIHEITHMLAEQHQQTSAARVILFSRPPIRTSFSVKWKIVAIVYFSNILAFL